VQNDAEAHAAAKAAKAANDAAKAEALKDAKATAKAAVLAKASAVVKAKAEAQKQASVQAQKDTKAAAAEAEPTARAKNEGPAAKVQKVAEPLAAAKAANTPGNPGHVQESRLALPGSVPIFLTLVAVIASAWWFKSGVLQDAHSEASTEPAPLRHREQRRVVYGSRNRAQRGRPARRQQQQTQQQQLQQQQGQWDSELQGIVRPDKQEPQWWQQHAEYHGELHERAPDLMTCPISGHAEIMRDPWMLIQTGSTFEHRSLYCWVVENRKRADPQTKESLNSPLMAANHGLRRAISNWCDAEVLIMKEEEEAIRRSTKQPVARPLGNAGGCGSGKPPNKEQVHIFVDDSNLMLGASAIGRVDIRKFAEHLEQGVEVMERVVVGSGSIRTSEWEAEGYTVMRDPKRGKECFVDEALLAQISRTGNRQFEPRRTLILCSGDGNSNSGRYNFPEAIEAALRNKWRVRVYGWKGCVHRHYATFAREYKQHQNFRLVHLNHAAHAFMCVGAKPKIT
jgi:hypothetical protein